MEVTTTQIYSCPSDPDLERLRQSLTKRYPFARNVPGAQLAAFIREQLGNADLRGQFGGLKNLVTRHFPAEIIWRGKKGLDDLYDICFDSSGALGDELWRPVPPEPSPWLWSSVTNPSFATQFAWSCSDAALMHAASGIALTDGLTSVQKLSHADYQEIARRFIATIGNEDAQEYLKVIEGSATSVEFTTLMREQGLLSKWEQFRVQNAVRLFVDRLVAGGAADNKAAQWGEVLRLSQQATRSQRLQSSSGESREQKRRLLCLGSFEGGLLESKAVAARILEYLSDTELSELRLPLGTVMRAVRSLLAPSR